MFMGRIMRYFAMRLILTFKTVIRRISRRGTPRPKFVAVVGEEF